MRELTYTAEEKRRLDENGMLKYPKFPQDLYYEDFSWHSKKHPELAFYAKHIRQRYEMKCYITDCKNTIRDLLNKEADGGVLDSMFTVLLNHLNYNQKCEKAFAEYLQIGYFVHHYYDEGDD